MPKPGKEPTFSNIPRDGEAAISTQFGPGCGNDPVQGLQQAFGRPPRPGEYYRQTTLSKIRDVAGRNPIYDGGQLVDGHLMPVGSVILN